MKKRIKSNIQRIFKTIYLIFSINKKLSVIVFVLTILSGLAPTISVLLSQSLLNSLQIQTGGMKTTITIFVFYILFSIFADLISSVSSYYSSKLQILLNYKLNYIVMEKCGELSVEQFENSDIYDQITRLENDISTKPYQTFQAILTFISSLVTLLSVASILFLWKPWTIILVIAVPCISAFYYLKIGQEEFEMRYKRSNKERESWYLSYLMTHDFAFKEIKVNNLKDFFLTKYWNLKDDFINQENAINKKQGVVSILFNILQELVSSAVLILAIIEAFEGKLLLGNVTSYIKSVSMIQNNTMSIITSLYSIYNSNMYMNLLDLFMELPCDPTNQGEEVNQIQSIKFDQISYSYESTDVLQNIEFKIEKGDKVAIIGKNGSGKTTLLKILAGLYKPSSGAIYINDISLEFINKNSYRDRMSVLFQDFLKLEMSLLDNIALGELPDKQNRRKVTEVLGKLEVDFLKKSKFKNKYLLDKQLGNWFNDGQELSGGQWQKIALARAHYKNCDVYLLDEPSAALDATAEAKVFDEFFKLPNEKIGVFITHKIGVAKGASKIIVLDNGHVVGIGTHDQLLSICSTYRELYEKEISY
ncbi:ABC transporter ATP-binding protein [Facklamia miroungae]|uniref:ABC-type bacteriocin/lantibiotic exporter, contains an N-terminal double-glycine peptidase domain n=1 Tax=Facklamia miroungae TaxID=120956 RepID=A0A1G7SQ31_9LACT|nr:ABC transporter ATP-binding protein [Facklamia miroungae]NKZ29581.1 ABC transporter ATP-binding protein [Facklamia miroungae]SDG24924.1 ABC-type bacteriocin/lantibiotic exporter, contains an N-terminal double-glycine peptidase domain [Facklamia miroungae]